MPAGLIVGPTTAAVGVAAGERVRRIDAGGERLCDLMARTPASNRLPPDGCTDFDPLDLSDYDIVVVPRSPFRSSVRFSDSVAVAPLVAGLDV